MSGSDAARRNHGGRDRRRVHTGQAALTGRRLLACALVALAAFLSPSLYERATFSPLAPDVQADRLVIRKAERTLTAFRDGSPLKSYAIVLGREPVGPKQFEGDLRTPEGTYVIDGRLAESRFHMALHLSYPGPEDVERAQAAGRSAGSAIMIHGLRNGLGWVGPLHRMRDWTAGCVAVTNREIEELWRIVPDGTPVEIEP